MAAKKRSERAKEAAPRREIVEVFRALRLDEATELKRQQHLGELSRGDQLPPTYYSIEVTGTLDYCDCALSI